MEQHQLTQLLDALQAQNAQQDRTTRECSVRSLQMRLFSICYSILSADPEHMRIYWREYDWLCAQIKALGGEPIMLKPVTDALAAPPAARVATPDATGAAFHAHLDACAQCREHPMDLCAVGAGLLVPR